MRSLTLCSIVVGLLFVGFEGAESAGIQPQDVRLSQRAPAPPKSNPWAPKFEAARADTQWFGRYELVDGESYALSSANKEDVVWTFDRGDGPFDPPPPYLHMGGGWSVRDMTHDLDIYFRLIDEGLDLGEGVPAPIIRGQQSLWIGLDQAQADSLCWEGRSGYGHDMCQRVSSEPLSYDGGGSVSLSFLYYSNAEPCYDGTQVYLRREDGSELLLNPYTVGACPTNPFYRGGTFTDSIGDYANPALYERVITAQEIGDPQQIEIVIEFTSDVNGADEDGNYLTTYGPFCVDSLSIQGGGIDVAYEFETGLQGWTPFVCPYVGDFTDIVDVGCYTILDPCDCRLDGNILEMHANLCNDGLHPAEQRVRLYSPICDFGTDEPKSIFMDFWIYLDMGNPFEGECMWHRWGWHYYPWTCPVTGEVGWSPLVGMYNPWWIPGTPSCGPGRVMATDNIVIDRFGNEWPYVGPLVPAQAEKVIAVIDLIHTPQDAPLPTNFTPLYDNIAVGMTTAGVSAPIIQFAGPNKFQDVGSSPSHLFDPRAEGPANTRWDLNYLEEGEPRISGDSLVIMGPEPGENPDYRWEARMWWRVSNRGPFQADFESGQPTRYKIWRDRIADGREIDRPDHPQFTSGLMDSLEWNDEIYTNEFCSMFREDDDDFMGEGEAENEMIWDDILRPGTRIEYFMTSNYLGTPYIIYCLPDTSGGYYYEFEILPGLRTADVPECGGMGFDHCVFQPAILHICEDGQGQRVLDQALRTILNGLDLCQSEDGCEIPVDRNWDRYDTALFPMARGEIAGSNNGLTLNQLLGYRAIIVTTGNDELAAIHTQDYQLFDDWLRTPDCSSNLNRQVFIMNGDHTGETILAWEYGDFFLSNTLGATLLCESFNGITNNPNCGDENISHCVRVLPVDGGPYTTETDVDAWGNHCPYTYGFSVFALNGGIGNRYYSAEDGLKEMSYAQVVNENLGPDGNYRTVLDGVSWDHLSRRDGGAPGDDRCPNDFVSILEAATAEIGAALKWGFGVSDYASIPKLTSAEELAMCQGTWQLIPADLAQDQDGNARVTRLYQNQPNPMNPTTTIRFSLAKKRSVEILIFDVSGRLVRTLIDNEREVGLHSVVWDGGDDAGHPVGSGVYWIQMNAGRYQSNKKMVVLK